MLTWQVIYPKSYKGEVKSAEKLIWLKIWQEKGKVPLHPPEGAIRADCWRRHHWSWAWRCDRKSSLGRGENVERHRGERVGDMCGKYLYYTLWFSKGLLSLTYFAQQLDEVTWLLPQGIPMAGSFFFFSSLISLPPLLFHPWPMDVDFFPLRTGFLKGHLPHTHCVHPGPGVPGARSVAPPRTRNQDLLCEKQTC